MIVDAIIAVIAFGGGTYFGVRALPKVSPRLHRKLKGW